MDGSLISVIILFISNIVLLFMLAKVIEKLKESQSLNASYSHDLELLKKQHESDIEALKKQPAPTVELKQFIQDMMINSSGLLEIKRVDPNNLFYHNIRG